jgi:hypothetical protein
MSSGNLSGWSSLIACLGVAHAGCAAILGIEDLPPIDAGGEPVDARAVDARPGVDAAADANVPPDAAPPAVPRDVVHVPEDGWFGGDTAVVWNADVTIDTTALTLTGPGVAGGIDGIVFDTRPQEPGGPELAVMHLGDWTVSSGVTVRVVGNRPFVVVSSGDIVLEGVIDAGARGQAPGAGGAGPGQGDGAGGNGGHDDSQDSGGGGAGHATAGARGSIGCSGFCGGPGEPAGGVAGTAYGDVVVTTLAGGAGGGAGGSGTSGALPGCPPGVGGAGGGAVQLYTVGTITIGGSGGGILAGGGGGTRGGQSGTSCASSAGGGGGAGGVIYVQAERIELDGTLAANGGGGGSGAEPNVAGFDGSDGTLSLSPAPGGADPGDDSSAGGRGGAASAPPAPGADDDENGGGGGGAVGYIVLRCEDLEGDGAATPAPHFTAGCQPP